MWGFLPLVTPDYACRHQTFWISGSASKKDWPLSETEAADALDVAKTWARDKRACLCEQCLCEQAVTAGDAAELVRDPAMAGTAPTNTSPMPRMAPVLNMDIVTT
jgi:hypothetical protein